ncbi:hypothetical protein GBF38_004961 [Nibea albiflora]|uniref:Uncharacterized protein n=1 Tax=Nibea albiflora TaxID=240163 RepID=A0ACB7EV42_NIBAL|nr:hypothetical protein GBF38_004961 [Nibea albiflora]
MSVNSSFNSSGSSVHLPIVCIESTPGIFIFVAFFVANVFLLPLFILVLYLGYRRGRQQRPGSAAGMTSHSDIFTYNMMGLELISVLGCCFYCCGALTNVKVMISVGMYVFSITSPGQTLFHLLTCVERYLAVVHPITYLGLRQAGGVRIRNISIGCVWLFSLGSPVLTKVCLGSYAASVLLGFSLLAVSFCSISVLSVLIRPRQREVGGKREQVDQTKLRAFYTIVAIMGALVLRFAGILFSHAVYSSILTEDSCVVGLSLFWLTLPSSLVLPLLFLHRAGRLPGCERSTEPG